LLVHDPADRRPVLERRELVAAERRVGSKTAKGTVLLDPVRMAKRQAVAGRPRVDALTLDAIDEPASPADLNDSAGRQRVLAGVAVDPLTAGAVARGYLVCDAQVRTFFSAAGSGSPAP
jgi:hypothetical protein